MLAKSLVGACVHQVRLDLGFTIVVGLGLTPFFRSFIMATGIVKWFNPTKGYGFIQPDQGGADVFVHITALEAAGLRSLNEGQKVSYELATNKGKTSAANLKIAA
jgi:CspA family cold shock protein